MNNGTRLAALDLGSNSFRLEIAVFDKGHFQRTHYLKETVRQGNGINEDGFLSDDAMQRGWDCLLRFAEQLQGFNPRHVRAVATQTLREAKNRGVFLHRAKQILGFDIDVVGGQEEARLIYQGVVHSLSQSDERRLVLDIGGRSTEMIVGQSFLPQQLHSHRVGSVAWSMLYFGSGELSERAFQRASVAAQAIFDETAQHFHPSKWDVAYGASGTMGAVVDVLSAAGSTSDANFVPECVTRTGLKWLMAELIKAKHTDKIQLLGLKEDKRNIIAGGVAILWAIFELLKIDRLQQAHGALRHGVLHELVNRDNQDHGIGLDVRHTSVHRMAQHFAVDKLQANRVANVACHFLTALFKQETTTYISKHDSQVFLDADHLRWLKKLNWAAQLHEVGCHVAHSGYHKHGAYILDHAEAPGFDEAELHRIGQLVLGQRGKLKNIQQDLLSQLIFTQQLVCLRLAVLLCHARVDMPDFVLQSLHLRHVQPLQTTINEHHPVATSHFTLHCKGNWRETFPQSVHLLQEEEAAWKKTQWAFVVVFD